MRGKKTSWIFLFLLVNCGPAVAGNLSITDLLLENETNPVGIDILQPCFSWRLVADERGIRQTAYEVRVGTSASALSRNENLIWATGKKISSQSVHVSYAGKILESGVRYFWQVRVWDNAGNVSDWSSPAYWQMGLLKPSDWKAEWIETGYREDSRSDPSPLFRREFDSPKKIRSATAFLTAHGLYEAYINGHRVGDAHLTPGWTSYNKRLQYQVYDVTDLIGDGKNAIGVMLGSGWYRSTLGWGKINHDIYGKDLGLLFQMEVIYTDGTKQMIASDESWKCSAGAIRSSEIYAGEVIDARLEKKGWSSAGYDDQGWSAVKAARGGNGFGNADRTTARDGRPLLTATYNEAVKEHETFIPVRIFRTPEGDAVMDFGQNLTGFVRVSASGRAGDTIVIDHAEVLDKAGNFYTKNYRTARSQNKYILAGNGIETFEPHFTYQGFRYIRVKGYPGELKPENFTAVALYSDMRPTGSFSCSNPLLDQLQHNIQWGQRGNFLDVPTDCPQRDERLGWTGDAQVFSATAAYNRHVYNFFAKWLKDISVDQFANGSMPYVVPNVLDSTSSGSTGWGDVATIIPWQLYLSYGDKRVLEAQYGSMKAWVGYMKRNSRNDLWDSGFHIGDWLSYHPEDDYDGRSAVTDKYLIAQCYYAHSTQLLINAAKVLGRTEDERSYTALLQRIKAAFVQEYVSPNGRLSSGTQTAYVLALQFDMLPEKFRQAAIGRLIGNIKDYGGHLTTGFLGTPYLCGVLSRYGREDEAYKLLLQETYPSWLYPVKQGATTIWERWDGIRPDGTFENPDMNSFNHYAYGAIGDWMYNTIAGINTDPVVTGYRKIIIKPHPGGGLTKVSAGLETYYGKIGSQWTLEDGKLRMDVEIPPNTSATVYIPSGGARPVTGQGQPLTISDGITGIRKEAKYTVVEIGSGKYSFVAQQ